MDWVEGMSRAMDYMERHLDEDLDLGQVAQQACVSSFYFQKAFAILCGVPVGEYLRRRRLTLAGQELVSTDHKIIDIALRYGYDSPDSFTKAFTRFHGATPSAVRKEGAALKAFAPLKIHLTLEGGYIMDYKIVEKEAFTLLGVARTFHYDTAFAEIPKFWSEHCQSEQCKVVGGMYGLCLEETGGNQKTFDYLIADNYLPWNDVPEGFRAVTLPKGTWAVFPCKGAMPDSLQSVNGKIFSEWLPNCREYELAGGYNIELYSDPSDFPKGNQDKNYRSEIWIPLKKK